MCLVEIYAAGPQAIARRRRMHEGMAALNAHVLGVTDERGLPACRMLVAASIALVSGSIAENDIEGLRAVRPELTAFLRSLWNAGAFGAGTGPS